MSATPTARPFRRLLQRLLLLVAVSVLMLAAGELVVRRVDGSELWTWRLRPHVDADAEAATLAENRGFVDAFLQQRAEVWPDLDPAWFRAPAARLPPYPVPAAMAAQKAAGYDRVFLWACNEDLLRSVWQRGVGVAALAGLRQPDWFYVFSAPDHQLVPRYRYPPSTTLPTGLTTNAFGCRGRELTADKPPHVVRIACVGASTTIDDHRLPHSYPELLEHFLNQWARARALPVVFEVINAGCEAYFSPDIRATVHHYVLPLAVDYVVFYEGANHFHVPQLQKHVRLGAPAGPPPDLQGLDPATAASTWWTRLCEHSAAAMRLRGMLARGAPLPEPQKPPQTVVLPAGLDAEHPDLARAGEMFDFGTVFTDLAAIRADVEGAGARLVICSFRWFVRDGLRLDPVSGELVYRQLNKDLWPLSYATMRTLADVQNCWFQAWARANDLDFLDVAAQLPMDQRLYLDAIHNTMLGARMHAWVAFAGLTRILERDLGRKLIPVPDTHPDAVHPNVQPLRQITRAELDGR